MVCVCVLLEWHARLCVRAVNKCLLECAWWAPLLVGEVPVCELVSECLVKRERNKPVLLVSNRQHHPDSSDWSFSTAPTTIVDLFK